MPPGFQGSPGEVGVLHSHWSLTWDAVDAERAGRSEDASSKHSWVTGWFQAEVLEMANFYWPLTSAGSPRWKPNFHWLMAQAGLRGQPRAMLNFHWPRRPTASLATATRLQASWKLARAVHGRRILRRCRRGQVSKAASWRRHGVSDPVEVALQQW